MCGVVGIIHADQAPEELLMGMQNLQHRGQDGGGMAVVNTQGIDVYRALGLVNTDANENPFLRLKGHMGIGHTRYGTVGSDKESMLQPFVNDTLGLAIVHNGNLVNYLSLKERYLTPGQAVESPYTLTSDCDSEIILATLSQALSSIDTSKGTETDLINALTNAVKVTSDTIVGSYSVIGFWQPLGLFAFRDTHGLRPLVLGERPNGKQPAAWAVASESAPLEYLGFDAIESVAPGELVIATHQGSLHRQIYKDGNKHACMFEWVYFARVESTLDDLSVYRARFQLGVTLAQQIQQMDIQPDIIVPIPETSRIAAIAMAETLNIPFREVLIKNRYVNRTFILRSHADRVAAIRKKLYPIASELKGKKVLVVDDSIVRGNTAIKIVQMFRQCGVDAIYLASTCPPIQNPCYYGIDFPSKTELLAGQYSPEALAGVLGVEKVIYQTLDGLRHALDGRELCTACLDGNYPTDISEGVRFSMHRDVDRQAAEAQVVLT